MRGPNEARDGIVRLANQQAFTTLVLAMALFLFCAMGGALLVLGFVERDPRGIGEDIPFSSEVWKAESDDDPNVRLRMLHDLLDNVGLIGRRRDEIEALLGLPDSESWSDYYPNPGYHLGLGRIDWLDGPRRTGLILVYDEQSICRGTSAYYDEPIAQGVSARTRRRGK